jgi:hypothetical protein
LGNTLFQGCTSLATVTLGTTLPAIGTTIFQEAATTAKTVTFKVPDPTAYASWNDMIGVNKDLLSYYKYAWDNNPSTRDNLTVALVAIGG